MTTKSVETRIRPMEPDDLDAVRDLDRKITGMKRTPTYRDMLNEAFGGAMGLSFIAEADGKMVGLVLARIGYVPEQISEVCLIQVLGVDPEAMGFPCNTARPPEAPGLDDGVAAIVRDVLGEDFLAELLGALEAFPS